MKCMIDQWSATGQLVRVWLSVSRNPPPGEGSVFRPTGGPIPRGRGRGELSESELRRGLRTDYPAPSPLQAGG